MSTPSFLGIAAPRSGTTWLSDLLTSHPDIYMPKRRKEISYFDLHYDRGKIWYERFFPDVADSKQYRAIGEFTPNYLFYEPCLKRIADFQPAITHLIMILRNPADRLYSHYTHMQKVIGYKNSFESFLTCRHSGIAQGYYFKNLQRFLKYYTPAQILVLIYENAVTNIEETKSSLADFLDIDQDLFPAGAGRQRVNESRVPVAPLLSSSIQKLVIQLRNRDMDWIVNTLKRTRIDRLHGRKNKQLMDARTRKHLDTLYASDIEQLEEYLQRKIIAWRY